ncbi:hypothetical protein M407DRAFT_28570 [Tulasnella calospora MUT 4182]|uniref:Uncharacterized protein n=1 Tax=Tulasnella calospora MUT 4182 TaxID=1051891 RepID=A0A0C3Q166_9AGAM|nr:hypothetical protein M407DRAFT_28570 [Tulasnella calospora MUT 4182]
MAQACLCTAACPIGGSISTVVNLGVLFLVARGRTFSIIASHTLQLLGLRNEHLSSSSGATNALFVLPLFLDMHFSVPFRGPPRSEARDRRYPGQTEPFELHVIQYFKHNDELCMKLYLGKLPGVPFHQTENPSLVIEQYLGTVLELAALTN